MCPIRLTSFLRCNRVICALLDSQDPWKQAPFNHSTIMKLVTSSIPSPNSSAQRKPQNGFPKVVAGGRIIRIDSAKPYLQRMVTGDGDNSALVKSKEQAVIESIKANLEAGVRLVDVQETSLAKVGGKLSEMALCLNRSKAPEAESSLRQKMQEQFSIAKKALFKESLNSFDQTALFSNGPAKPVTIAVPTGSEWEGLSIDRADIGQPGLKTVMNGKVYGDSPGVFLDHETIRRAFSEWRSLCTQNRLNWVLLVDRLHGISLLQEKMLSGVPWQLPEFPSDPGSGPLRRPHRNN